MEANLHPPLIAIADLLSDTFPPYQTLLGILGSSINNIVAFTGQIRKTVLRTWTRNSTGVVLIHSIASLFCIDRYVYHVAPTTRTYWGASMDFRGLRLMRLSQHASV